MANKSRATFEKRQKERARQEKQRDKQARRFAAKAGKDGALPTEDGDPAAIDGDGDADAEAEPGAEPAEE